MTIRVGIVGLNHGAEVHLPAYKAHPAYEVVAVCARTPGRAQAVAREHRIPRWYASARDLIAAPDVDLVSVATPPRTHPGLAAAAFAAGKHAVVEVAFVPNAADARVLVDLAGERGRVGAPTFVLRYTPTLRLVTELLAQGRIGQARLMRFELFNGFLVHSRPGYEWVWDAENGGGIFANYTAHALDLALRWFGPAREVDATLATFSTVRPAAPGTLPADDTGQVTVVFESGVLATFAHSAVTAYARTGMEIHGSEGSILIEGYGSEAALLPLGETSLQPLFPPEAYLEETRGHSGLLGGFDVFLERLTAPLSGAPAPADLPTLADGLAVARLVDAVRLAARERRRVQLSEIP